MLTCLVDTGSSFVRDCEQTMTKGVCCPCEGSGWISAVTTCLGDVQTRLVLSLAILTTYHILSSTVIRIPMHDIYLAETSPFLGLFLCESQLSVSPSGFQVNSEAPLL